MTQEELVVESWPTPRWVMFLIFCRLVYNIPFHLNNLVLVWSAYYQKVPSTYLKCLVRTYTKKLRHQNSRLVYEISPFLKEVVSVISFLGLMIVIESMLWNWKEKVQFVMYQLNQLSFQGLQKFTLVWSGAIYKLSIATGMINFSHFFLKKSSIYIYFIHRWCIITVIFYLFSTRNGFQDL